MTTRTLGIGSLKGGVAKTTTALHLGAALASAARPVLVIDGDPLRPLTAWASAGRLPHYLVVMDEQRAARTGAARDVALVVLDLAGGDADALTGVAGDLDILVVPSTPDALALSAAQRTLDALPTGANARVLLTMIPPKPSKAGESAAQTLRDAGLTVLRTTVPRLTAFADAAAVGCLVSDLPGPRAARGADAYRLLAKEVQTWLSGKRQK